MRIIIKYYSGTALYKITFSLGEIHSRSKIKLDLGNQTAMARVKVNGKDVGGVWTAPWEVYMTSAVSKVKISWKSP